MSARPRKRGRASHTEEVSRIGVQPPRKEPELPIEALRRYITRYNLRTRPPMTFYGFLCHGSAGRHTQSGKQNARSTYAEAAAAVKEHLHAGVIKESEATAEFIYSVQLQERNLKVPLGLDMSETKLESLPEEAVEGN